MSNTPAAAATRLLAGVLRLAGQLPLRWQQAAGRRLGDAIFLAHTTLGLVTRANVAWCFPELDTSGQRRLCRQSLRADGELLLESLWVAAHANVDAAVANVSGFELFADIRAGGDGAITLVPHAGNWELLHAWTARRLQPTVMYRRARRAPVAALIQELRQRGQTSTLVPADWRGVTQLARTLRNQGVVAILPDQAPPRGVGITVPFFGHPALTITLPARLAATVANVRIVLACATRRPDGRFDLSFEELLPRRDSDAMFMTDINAAIEALVRRAPAQYQWGYRRFKREAAGAFRYYP